MGHDVAILGASGYAGGELIRAIDAHPSFEVGYLGAHSKAGSRLADVHPHLDGSGRKLGGSELDDVPDVELAFLALPHGASWEIGDGLNRRGIKVVDLGSDYRLDTAARYESAYGEPHHLPDMLASWAYGLPELFRDSLIGADLVASPGCYPTAALLGLDPLLGGGLIEPTQIVVNALSGVSGAGRKTTDSLMYSVIDESVAAYTIGSHRHRPEIEMALESSSGVAPIVSFTPHLAPMQRGLLSTSSAPLTQGTGLDDLQRVIGEAYAAEPFVEVSDRPPHTRWVVGSNKAIVHVTVDDHAGRAIVVVVIDNLIKGAAGQAVQAANLMFEIDEAAGLQTTGWMP